jgi:hypothetical protein
MATTHTYTFVDINGDRITAGFTPPSGTLGDTFTAVTTSGSQTRRARKSLNTWVGEIASNSATNDSRKIAEVIDPATPAASGNPLDFIIVGGQSNGMGHGLVTELPSPFPSASVASRIWMYTAGGEWLPASEPTHLISGSLDGVYTTNNTQAGVGPVLKMCEALTFASQSREFAIIPCAVGGSEIADWTTSFARGTSNYGAMIGRVRNALRRPGARLCCLVWYQGEADTVEAGSWATFTAATTGVLNNIESDLGIGSGSMKTLVVKLSANNPAPGTWVRWEEVRTAQTNLTSGSIRRVIQAPDLPAADIHLSTAQQHVLGQLLADEFGSLGW